MPDYTHLGNIADGTAAIAALLAAAEQPGTTLQHEKRNLISVRSTFIFADGDLPAILAGLTGSTHPRYAWAGYESSGQIVEKEGGLHEMTALFQGTLSELEFNIGDGDEDDDNLENPPETSTGGTVFEEHIATNPEYNTLTDLDKLEVVQYAENPENYGTYPADYTSWVPKKQQMFDKLAAKKTHWLAQRATHTVRYTSTTAISEQALRRLGTITRPWGRPPVLDEGRNWILHAVTQNSVGSAYDITLTWMSSGPGGWDADHYSPTRGQATA
jgi:hypothetical protein